MRVCFVVGHEDTPEAYWRVLLPARHFRAPALLLDAPGAMETALSAEVLWLHSPTGFAAAELAEKARAKGRRVVVDLSEDPWLRVECDQGYNEHRLGACARALEAAHLVVVASPALVSAFASYGRAQLVEPVVPLAGYEPIPPREPKTLCWWSDGRQRRGFEGVAQAITQAFDHEPALELRHVQYAHLRPLIEGMADREARAARAGHFHAYLEGDLGADGNLRMLRDAARPCWLGLETYPAGGYQETVSDLALLRMAALGVPSLTTRPTNAPGIISAPAEIWGEVLPDLLADQTRREELSRAARAWAERRNAYERYHTILEEVLT
ncbi:MAG: hypothetical protein M1325_01190 [Actinobacteria bacterium]|nr:hypothetical protein [Actinomycetota bacterium]